jgi:hypothetical protein
MALVAVLATPLCFHGFSPMFTTARHHDDTTFYAKLDKELDEVVDLAAESSGSTPSGNKQFAGCDQLVIVRGAELLHNNLGGKGPDKGEEGMMYRAGVYMKDVDGNVIAGKGLKIAIHATSPYEGFPKNDFNGLHGKFLSILLKSGKSVNISVGVFDEETNEPFTLPYFSITFFDLDMSEKKGSAEYIIARDFKHYYVANGTQLNITGNDDGSTTFHATQIGTGADNPEESEGLTPVSKSKGVTLQYQFRNATEFTLGTEEGNSKRGFLFILRPSMLCAETIIDGEFLNPMDDSIDGVDLPLMDGAEPVSGMLIPIMHVSENGEVIVITDNNETMKFNMTNGTNGMNDAGNNNGTETIENVSAVVDNENGTVTIEEENGTQILENGTVTDVNGTVVVNTTDTGNSSEKNTKNTKGKAGPKSGTIATLIVVTQLAVVWPFGNLQ